MDERSWIIWALAGTTLWSATLGADIAAWITGRTQIPHSINQALLITGGTAVIAAVILWDRACQRAEWITAGYRIRVAQEAAEHEANPVHLTLVR